MTPIDFDTPNDSKSFAQLKKEHVTNFEKEFLTDKLTKHAGNVSAAAREAKLDRRNFIRLTKRHGLKAENFRTTTTE
jgi:transcriptional regulator with GAF, ATPase, and Fis domain